MWKHFQLIYINMVMLTCFQSGAKINISDSSCPERIVTVTGTTDQIFKAFTMICKKFEEVRMQLNLLVLHLYLQKQSVPFISDFLRRMNTCIQFHKVLYKLCLIFHWCDFTLVQNTTKRATKPLSELRDLRNPPHRMWFDNIRADQI